MASISSPNVLQIKNAAGVVVTGFARSIRFFGGLVVTDIGGGQADVDGTGAAGSPWDVLGNAGGGLKLGTNTASAWDMIVNALTRAGFEADGRYFVSAPGAKKHILALDVDPSAGAGVAADIGSLALVNVAGTASAWLKIGAPDTAWIQFPVSAVIDWAVSGNNLTGGTPNTPNEYFGSNNDYDVVFKRNGSETGRFADDGVRQGFLVGPYAPVWGSPVPLQVSTQDQGIPAQVSAYDPAGNPVVVQNRLGRLSTVGAVTDTLDFPIFLDRSEATTVDVIGRAAGGETISFRNLILLKNIAGAVTVISDAQIIANNVEIPLTSASFSVVGSNLRLTVQGAAGFTIKWGAVWQGLEV